MQFDFCPICEMWIGGKAQCNTATLDHFIPRFMVGETMGELNHWYICNDCNNEKAGKLPTTEQTFLFNITKGFCK